MICTKILKLRIAIYRVLCFGDFEVVCNYRDFREEGAFFWIRIK